MHPTKYLELAASNSIQIASPYDEQIQMARILYDSMMKQGVIQVSQGPTGMGKTLVVISVGKSLADEGKRVLIAEPTYNHLTDNVLQEFQLISDGPPPPIRYGISNKRYANLICPRGAASCDPTKKECQKFLDDCLRAREYDLCRKSDIVLTVHHLIVYKQSYMNEFDAILIDESHGLPNVIHSSSYKTLSKSQLRKLLKSTREIPEVNDLLLDVEEVFDAVHQRVVKEKPIPASRAEDALITLRKAASAADEVHPDLADWKFFGTAQFTKKGKLFALANRGKFSLNDNISVGLISATIEDPRAHVRDCKFESLILQPPDRYDTERFRRRFYYRPIFSIVDGPRLGKNDPANYSIFRAEANAIIRNIVKITEVVTLILCQNQRDADSIYSTLKSDLQVKGRLTVLPDETEDSGEAGLDSYETFIKNEIDSGKKVIIATASSRLWEGANVPDLKCIVIDALPYRQPRPDELDPSNPRQRARAWKNMRRFMLNKVQQGIGRLVRREGDWGIAVIIDGRFYSGRNQFFKDLPEFIKSRQIFRWTPQKRLISELEIMFRKLQRGDSGRKDKMLDQFQD